MNAILSIGSNHNLYPYSSLLIFNFIVFYYINFTFYYHEQLTQNVF